MPNESPNSFVAKVYDAINDEWRPLYKAPDATDAVQGDVYLSDDIDSTLSADTGMTAATPAAVKAANDNANTKIPNEPGSVSNSNLAPDSVTSDKIQNGTIKGEDIANGTITGSNVANGTITGGNIADSTIINSNIADATITGDKLAQGTVTGGNIMDGTITGSHIADGTIQIEDLSDDIQDILETAGQLDVEPNRALISNSDGTKVTSSDITSTELGYLDGVTSNVQTQLNGKAPTNHTHNYAGSSSAGGPANKVANALTISLNGTSQGAYDGSAAKSINITASSIGASSSSHTHDYLPIGGGKMTGAITLQPQGGSWGLGKTSAPLMCGDASKVDGSEYSPIIMGKTANNDVWNLGHGPSDQVGFFGFAHDLASTTSNSWAHYIKVSDGTIHLNKNMYSSMCYRCRSSNMNASTTATSAASATGSSQIIFEGSTGDLRGGVQINQTDDNKWGTGIITQRSVGGTTIYSISRQYISRTGERTYSLSDPAAFRGYLGLGKSTSALPVANGGTGATTKKQAKTNLGIFTGTGAPTTVSGAVAGDIYIKY